MGRLSCEGTTQGDPLAMAMYTLGVMPLIRRLNHLARQLWFMDDASAGGHLTDLMAWWKKLNQLGPAFGYYPNASKTWLVVKEDLELAQGLLQLMESRLLTAATSTLDQLLEMRHIWTSFYRKKSRSGCVS